MNNVETANFYNLPDTFNSISTSLTNHLFTTYSQTFIKLVITDISDTPAQVIVNNYNISAVTITGKVYFTSCIVDDIREFLASFKPVVTLSTIYNYFSSQTASVESMASSFDCPSELSYEPSRFYTCFPLELLPTSQTTLGPISTSNIITRHQPLIAIDTDIALEFAVSISQINNDFNNIVNIKNSLIKTINEYIIFKYSGTFVNYYLTDITISSAESETNEQSTMIHIIGTISFVQSYEREQILDSFYSFAPTINSYDASYGSFSITGSFSVENSQIANAVRGSRYIEDASSFTCVPIVKIEM